MSTWGRKCDASPGFGLPFLLVFDVAAYGVGDIGVLFFLFLAPKADLAAEFQCPLLAQSGHHAAEFQCRLSGVKRTLVRRR
jgi:hypothetical protein